MKWLSKWILRLARWKVEITVPDYPKAIICVAPHTSNWDFVWGKFAYWSVGRKTCFLMKASWFVFPIGWIFRALGGIPVYRTGKKDSLTRQIIDLYDRSERLTIAITPEGTRSRVEQWHTGFLRIAAGAGIPIVLGAIDYKNHAITITRTFHATGDLEADLARVKEYYKKFTGKHPQNFAA